MKFNRRKTRQIQIGNVAINGFGRIGRSILRIIVENDSDINVVAINDLGNYENLAYLLKHDSVMGILDRNVSIAGDKLIVDDRTIQLTSIKDPAELPWKEMDVDVVVESTGIFRDSESLNKHLDAGAKKALSESNGDFDNAVKYLREKGLADSKKRADKEANQGTIGDYIHFQQDRAVAGVLVELACETDFVAKSDEFKNVAKQVAMHIAALKPEFLDVEDVPSERIEEEKEIIKKQSENEGKPADVITKIVDGKISSFYKDYVLNEQTFCNPEFYEGQVGTMIEELSGKLGEKIYIKKFSRIEVGT